MDERWSRVVLEKIYEVVPRNCCQGIEKMNRDLMVLKENRLSLGEG